MKNNKDSLEDFFGRRLQEQSFEFDEAQWDKLAQRLDEEDDAGIIPFFSGNGYKAKIIIGIAIISIIAFLLGWHFRGYQPVQRVKGSSHLHISQLDVNKQGDKAVDEQYNATGDSEGDNLRTSKGLIKTNLPKPIEGTSGDGKDKGNDDGHTPTNGDSDIANTGDKMTKLVTGEVPINDFTTVPGEQTADIRKKINPVHTKRKPLELIADSQSIRRKPIAPLPLLGDSLVKPKAPWSRLAIGIFIAPDFNGTRISSLFKGFGGAIGATADYQLSNRLRIGAGFYLNDKRYGAVQGDYRPKTGTWANGIAPEQIDAQCLVLDIPVEISFRLKNTPKKSWWLHAGVSNYWMLSESYAYRYAYSSPGLVQGWEGKLRNGQPLSTINFSVSYSKRIGKSLSLLAVPYFKYYLQGIGYGSVKLLSSGINFGLRYQRLKAN